jgi:xanthine dehydrogenase small subunit
MSRIGSAEVPVGERPSGHRADSELRFTLNGRPVVLRNVDPKTLLIDFLRSSRTGLTGTKLSCGEGGCGACTVVLARRDPISGVVSEGPVNACLRPLCSLDGMAVTTTEGIGDHRNMNPIQERLVEHNGSQCGFCTPGFVMCMYGMLRTNASPSSEDVEGFFDGNLCRCTGFRPILDAMQSFVGDPAIIKAARGRDLPLEAFGPIREFEIGDGNSTWRRVTSVSQALGTMHLTDGRSVRLVNGNTSVGIYKRPIDTTDIFLDISQIGQLRTLSVDEGGFTIGGGVTYAALIDWLDSVIPTLHGDAALAPQVLRNHVLRIAGHQVRSAGTVGGCIMLVLGHVADGEPFPSDLFTVLAVLDATITLRRPSAPDSDETHPILQIPPIADFPEGCLLTSIFVPFTGAGEQVNTYKVARRFQNSHAIVNAGFLIGLDGNQRVTRCRIVFGGLRSIAWRAEPTEKAMVGQVWDQVQTGRAQATLREETDALEMADFGDGISDSYRRSLANNLFYKFLVQVSLPEISVDPRFADAGAASVRPISSGKHGTIPALYVAGALDAGRLRLESVAAALRNEMLLAEPSVTFDLETLPTGRPPRRDEAVAKMLADDPRFADAGAASVWPTSSGKHGTIPAPYVAGALDAGRLRLESVAGALREELLPAEPSVTYDLEKSLPAGRPPPRDETVAKILAEALTAGTTSAVAALAPLPMVKLGAELQATGEAKYTQDIALPREPLACQYVLSRRSFATFSHSASIPDLLKQLRCEFPGVRDYVTFADIPKPSPANQYNPDDPGSYDPVFANVYVTAVGQPIGLILADTVRTAHAAALRMQDYIVYDTTGLAAPVMTIDDAIARSSFLKDPKSTSIVSIKRLKSDDTWLNDPKPEEGATFVSGRQATGAQAHFYFETQSVLAVPGEMDRMTIYCSSQNVASCQKQVASALGVSTAKIEAKALRLGGGFGGKEVRAPFFSVAAAVAAWKTGEPVRLALDRNTDMQMVGKRHPFHGNF